MSKPAKPSIKALMGAVPISKSYAAVILNGSQPPPLNLAALIFCKTGWAHDIIAEMSPETVREIAEKQPWLSPKSRAA